MKDKIKKLFDTKTTHGKIMRACLFVVVLAIIFAAIYLILKATGLWEKVNSMDKIREIVQSGGVFSFLIFILFQILQTTVLQIPAIFVTIAGAVIFGRWPAFIMSYIAVMLGSIIMFWIGRKAGRRFLNWMIGKESSEKWIDRMSNGKYLFFLMMLFPMFPDDILCVVAGLTNMSFSFFLWTNLLARGVGIACTVFFGSGAIIPFHGWGLIVWGILIILVAILFYLSVRYKNKIDEIIKVLFKKKDKTNKETKDENPSTTKLSEEAKLLNSNQSVVMLENKELDITNSDNNQDETSNEEHKRKEEINMQEVMTESIDENKIENKKLEGKNEKIEELSASNNITELTDTELKTDKKETKLIKNNNRKDMAN